MDGANRQGFYISALEHLVMSQTAKPLC